MPCTPPHSARYGNFNLAPIPIGTEDADGYSVEFNHWPVIKMSYERATIEDLMYCSAYAMNHLITRFVRPTDIATLLRLETRQWDHHQAANASELQQRIELHPDLCVASFNSLTGEAVSSLFMKPLNFEAIVAAPTWFDCVSAKPSTPYKAAVKTLFGISLTSVNPAGTQALMKFFWPHALRAGWTEIYLGSPMPGFAAALERNPQLTATEYATQTRLGLPRDPQLRYYHQKGFREIVAVKPAYFPHQKSLHHAVLLRGRVPFSFLSALWRRLPWPVLKGLSSLAGTPA